MASSEPIVVRFSDEDRALIQQLLDAMRSDPDEIEQPEIKRLVEN